MLQMDSPSWSNAWKGLRCSSVRVSVCDVCLCQRGVQQKQLAFPDSAPLIILPCKAVMCRVFTMRLAKVVALSDEALAGGGTDLYQAHLVAGRFSRPLSLTKPNVQSVWARERGEQHVCIIPATKKLRPGTWLRLSASDFCSASCKLSSVEDPLNKPPNGASCSELFQWHLHAQSSHLFQEGHPICGSHSCTNPGHKAPEICH